MSALFIKTTDRPNSLNYSCPRHAGSVPQPQALQDAPSFVEGDAVAFDVCDMSSGPSSKRTDWIGQRTAKNSKGVLYLGRHRWVDCARDHAIPLESAQSPGEHLLADATDRSLDVVKAPRALDQRKHDHNSPFVANQAKNTAKTAAFDVDRLWGGQLHMTRSCKNAPLAKHAWSHS